MKTCGQILGELLKRLREDAKYSIADFAKMAGSSRAWIYDIEAGRKNVTPDEYDRLLKCLGVSAESAFAGFDRSGIPEDARVDDLLLFHSPLPP